MKFSFDSEIIMLCEISRNTHRYWDTLPSPFNEDMFFMPVHRRWFRALRESIKVCCADPRGIGFLESFSIEDHGYISLLLENHRVIPIGDFRAHCLRILRAHQKRTGGNL